MTSLSDSETNRLIKLLGMLGSGFDGERANAAAKANELIRSKGLTWESYILGGRSLKPEAGAVHTGPRPDAPRARNYSYEQGQELVAIVVTIVHESPKALLVDPGDGPAVWIPKSQIRDQQPHGPAHLIGIPRWLADAKGLTPWTDV